MSRGPGDARRRLEELATGSVGRLLVTYSWPALVAMSLNALYAVVDRVFIGQGCGVDAMAGLQLAMPLMMLLTAFGPFVGVGHSAVLSIKLGEGDRVASEKIVGETVELSSPEVTDAFAYRYAWFDLPLGWVGVEVRKDD